MRTTAIAGILILWLIFLFHDSHDVTKSIQVEKLNTFISEEGIEDPKIVKSVILNIIYFQMIIILFMYMKGINTLVSQRVFLEMESYLEDYSRVRLV